MQLVRVRCLLAACLALVVFLAGPAHAATPPADDAETAGGLYRKAIVDARAGRTGEALVVLESLVGQFPQRMDFLGDYALVLGWAGNHAAALSVYQTMLDREPGNRAALHGKIQSLAHLGAPQLALDLADRNPGVLAPGERDVMAADATASLIRWGVIAADTGLGAGRFAGIDRALADSEAAAARALDPAAELGAVERTLALDRVIALRDRYRMRDAVTLYEALAARPAAVPAYVKAAAASAYLYLERPERARDVYREALATEPNNLEIRLGLFYALAESEQHDEALAEAERAVAATPQWIDAWSPATIRENPAYARALGARAMAPLFANRVGEAERRLHELADRAPFHTNIRTDFASSMRARGWPRAAEQELRWILAADPNNSGALGERAGALLEMRDYRNAESALAASQAVAAEDGRVVRAARLSRVNDMRELIVEGVSGRSGGGPTGTEDHAIETWLYSSPLAYNYRAFTHLYSAQAVFAAGTGRRERAGVGLEYRSPLVVASGELSKGIHQNQTGAAVSLAYTPDDFWTLRGTADTSTNEIPLQAQLAGINARRISAEAIWRAHESRSAAVSLNYLDFSDGNRRDVIEGRWTERVIAGPIYKLEVTGALYASRNSLGAVPYFNPSRDFSPTLEFANEWIQWRRYTRAFRHRLVVAVGNYWQQGFGSGPVAGVRYEQQWDANDRLVFRYGIGRSLHPYDGVRETRNYGYFALNWRF